MIHSATDDRPVFGPKVGFSKGRNFTESLTDIENVLKKVT